MAALPYMPLYVADYKADAAHLSTLEHGAYLLLIMNYWQRGEPLPAESKRLARIAGLSIDEWAEIEPTISEFFEVTETHWVHNRVERELSSVREKSERARNAGLASAQQRFNTRSTPVQQSFNHTDTDTDTDTKIRKEKNTKKENPLAPLAEFDRFWNVYPRRVGRGAAMKALKAALKKTDIDTIIAGVSKYRFSDDPQYIPFPATWLNQERWADEGATEQPVDIKTQYYRRVTEAIDHDKPLTFAEAQLFRSHGFNPSEDIIQKATFQ